MHSGFTASEIVKQLIFLERKNAFSGKEQKNAIVFGEQEGSHMARRQKIQKYIVAAVMVCLVGWIAVLYVERHRQEKGWENQFLAQYSVALSDVTWHLGQFEEMKSFEDQLDCLEVITNDLMQLKAYMEMHIELLSVSKPKIMASTADSLGWHETETVIGLINNGGAINSDSIESFRADGVISTKEIAILQLLKEEAEKLMEDMRMMEEDGVNYEYALSSLEVYRRWTEIIQNVKIQLVRIGQDEE